MRIAILSPFYPYRGGIAQFSAMLYNQLINEGHQVEAFNFKRLYPDFLFPGKTQYVDENDEAIRINTIRLLDSINPLSFSKTVRAIKDFNPDVLIISYWMSFFVPGYAHIANQMKKHSKIIVLLHNAIPHEPNFFDKPLASLLFKQADGFIVLSENVREELQQLSPDAKYMLNPHPLYNNYGEKITKGEACNKLNIDSNKKNLLFFGLIRDYKGLDLLIEAVGKLDGSYQLIIAGESYGSFDKYSNQIKESEASKRIFVFNKYISDKDIPIYFSAADALILPYKSATQSGVVSIGYHYDLPMLSTPVGDFKQSIEIPGTGIVVDDISSKAIYKGIEDLFKPEEQARFHHNISLQKKALSWDVLTKKLLHFINEEI